MGKTTRFHPVSLPIIRENARQCAFILGRIHQDALKLDGKTALYTIEILGAPIPFGRASLDDLTIRFNHCYSTDIQVLRIWKTRSDKLYAEVVTTIDESLIGVDPLNWMTHGIISKWQGIINRWQGRTEEADSLLEGTNE